MKKSNNKLTYKEKYFKLKIKTKARASKMKKSSKIYLKTNFLFAAFVGSLVINSSLLRFLTVKNYFDIKPVIADFAIIIIIGAFGYFIKPKHQFKYYFIWSIIFTTVCIINSMYYTNYLSFSSISLLATSKQIFSVSDAIIENIMQLKDFFYLWQIVAMLYVNYHLKKKEYYTSVAIFEYGKTRAVNTLITGVIVFGVFIATLNAVDISRLTKQWDREYVVMQFGLYTYHVNDAILTIKSQINPLFGYDEKAKIFREYYAKRETNNKTNSYTNKLKGKNIIMIHAESIQTLALNTSFNGIDVAPNLKRLASEGLYFSNFYAQDGVGTSSDTEFTLNTSLMPTSSGTVFVNYFDREYITIEKLLNEQNYYTFSMHGNNGTFWNRNVMHKNMGYDRFYSYPEDYILDEKIGLGLSDVSFFNQSLPYIKNIAANNPKFFGTMIMLTNHTPFTAASKNSTYAVDYKYEKINPITKVKELVSAPFMENTKLGNYFKSVHYADQAIGNFINNLDQQGLLENTAIIIYGDHDSKLTKQEYEKYYNYDPLTDTIINQNDPRYRVTDYYSYELNRKVPFIIWTKDKSLKKEVTKVMGTIDVMPTLGNMMGFSNPYALGHDIFNKSDNAVVFPNGNWLTDKIYYNSQKEEWLVLNSGDIISSDYIDKYNKIADDDISISNSIIVYDLIHKSKETEILIEKNK